jgi:ADP-ribosylglycohydrolase
MVYGDILKLINHLKICSKCYEIYGFWNYDGGNKGFYQKCNRDCEDYNGKSDMPIKEIKQEKWEGFDFNGIVMFCYCCGQEALKSGSRWSVFFCEDCKRKVMELNAQFQRAIIPIGRHSMMNGIALNNDGYKDPKFVEQFWTKANNMFANIEKLSKWTAQRLSNNFKVLGYDDDVFLNDYLKKVAVAVDKSGAFREMCDFLLGMGFSDAYYSLRENDGIISEDDNHIDNHATHKLSTNEVSEQVEEKESVTEDQNIGRKMDEFVARTPDGKSYSSKPVHGEEWVKYVEDGEGVRIRSYAVVIKVKSINEKYKGGWNGFIQFCRENSYPLLTDNKLVTTYDGYFPELHCLLDSLKENGLQAKNGPVDFYLMDPFDSVLGHSLVKDVGWTDVYIGSNTVGTLNDYEIEVSLEKSSGDVTVRLKDDNWYKYHHIYSKAMELYKLGDVMGSLFEGSSVYYRQYTFEEIKGKYLRGGFRTDESDIVDCFSNFISDYHFKGELQLLLDWVIYHTKHRAHVKYGRTYKEHFLIVGTLKTHDDLTLERLFELSEDKNSFGNGCLALVYPVYHYAESLNLGMDGRVQLVINFCRLTHAHPYAISAVTLLYALIDIAMKGKDIFDSKEHSDYSQYYSQELKESFDGFLTRDVNLEPKDFIENYPNNIMALNTLFYALYCVRNAVNMEETVTNVISFNGDADSVNAVALMLWGILNTCKQPYSQQE